MKTILIVDDDTVFRERLRRALDKRGYSVRTVDTVAEAPRCISEGPLDGAVVDLRLPDGTGLEIVPKIVEEHPQCAIILLTGFGTIATAVDAIKLGARQYLTKPVDVDEILQALLGESPSVNSDGAAIPSLSQVEWEHIQRVLREYDGNISHAAKALGVHRRSLQRKLLKFPSALK